MSEKHACAGMTWDGWRHRNCARYGKFERDGAWFCGTHDPVAKQSRLDKRSAEWKRDSNIRFAEHKLDKTRRAAADVLLRCTDPLPDELAAARAAIIAAREKLDALRAEPHP